MHIKQNYYINNKSQSMGIYICQENAKQYSMRDELIVWGKANPKMEQVT